MCALQHIFSNVERGYFARHGNGFQTVAVAAELVGTDDLHLLESAAFYAVSSERRDAGEIPVKETFFRLPSGRFAIGRTVNWGTDSAGRIGNYLTHHVILSRDELIAAGARPLSLLDAMPLATADTDLTPRELPPLPLKSASLKADPRNLASFDRELLANLATAAVDNVEKTVLLIGNDARIRAMMQGLYATLPIDERLRLTLSTHFYESHHLRHLFAFVTNSSRAEAPTEREDYTVFDLDDNRFPQILPTSAYSDWLADCLRSGRREEIDALNVMLDRLRGSGCSGQGWDFTPTGARACAALWERAGPEVARVLIGDARLVVGFLRRLSSPSSLADSLLAAAAPSELCGVNLTPDMAHACLSTLRSAATRKGWRKWVQRWKDDPILISFLPRVRPWWQFWA